MKKTSKTIGASLALGLAAALALGACGSDSGNDGGGTTEDKAATELKIGASPTPHGEILRFVKENLATEAGLKLDIVEFTDYVLPNTGLNEGSIDGNYFQHLPYLEAQMEEFNYDFYAFEGVHIEPLGVYSEKHTDLTAVPDGAMIGVSNDPANQARGLRLLEAAGVFTLAQTEGDPTIDDLADNPNNVKLTQIDPQLLPKSLPDFDYAVINGNFAIDAGLMPSSDALMLEDGQDNPYANMLVVRAGDKDSPGLVKLNELLHSPEVKQFIVDTWTDGSVIPAF
ncbi:MAG: MetQ/NlpA family ABC transporter substrate-binding protein [Micrococcales bacterium]|nr:MetQ/NlpA family ABC transporter substrate-binding protein [Micrococcales bacterium]